MQSSFGGNMQQELAEKQKKIWSAILEYWTTHQMPSFPGSLTCTLDLRADSRIRSQDRGRRGARGLQARPVRREEGERLAVTNPVGWIFTAARTDRTEFGPSQYIDVFRPSTVKVQFAGALQSDRRRGRCGGQGVNQRASRSCTKSSVLDFCRRDNEDAPLGAPQLTQQVGMDRRTNPEVIFESALIRAIVQHHVHVPDVEGVAGVHGGSVTVLTTHRKKGREEIRRIPVVGRIAAGLTWEVRDKWSLEFIAGRQT